MTDLYFLHGMESSPQGTKAQLLKKHYPACIIPELPPNLAVRDQILQRLIKQPAWLIGSSLGGLSALFFAMINPRLVKAMVLLAPAVGFFDESIFGPEEQQRIHSTYIPSGIRCTILAALNDKVIPLVAIKELVDRSPDRQRIIYREVEDEHSLNRFPELLLGFVQKMVDPN